MPLQKLQFRPGVNRESTTLSNEGGWFDIDKVRFISGFPSKLGGWVKDNSAAFLGVANSLWNWTNLAGLNLLSIGTNLKFYIQNGEGGSMNDITPIRDTAVIASNAFTTNSTTTVTVNDTAHGAATGDYVDISAVSGAVNGIPAASLTGSFVITYVDADHYTITSPVTATSSGTSAVGATFAYEYPVGPSEVVSSAGWSAGPWGLGTWGNTYGTTNIRLWSQSNYGQDLIFCYRGSPLFYWANNVNPAQFDRATVISGDDAPLKANYVTVSDGSRFVIAFGCNGLSTDPDPTTQNPMLIRWSDQEDYSMWTPSATNQAGSYLLSTGSEIITAVQTRQEILVWTDAAIYSMQYLGPPYVWGFNILGSNISIIGPNTAITVNNITYWMGVDKFYMYSGRVETLPCTLRQFVYDDINLAQGAQFFAGTNEGYNEVWWFYCSADSDTIDRYVIYNHLERIWYYGTMARSAWLDSALRDYPMATGYSGNIIYHENGVDDVATGTALPIDAYIQSSDFDIGDGHNYGFVWRIIPDVTFDGSEVDQPSLNFTVRPRTNPGSPYGLDDNPAVTSTQNYSNVRTYNVQEFTEIVYVRARGRQMAFKVESTDLGVMWQLGAPRLDVRPDGRR